MTGSNRRPPACKAGALPAELIPQDLAILVVGLAGFEPATPALSRRCSNRLSYRPTRFLRAPAIAPTGKASSPGSRVFSLTVVCLQPISVGALNSLVWTRLDRAAEAT